MDIQFYIICLNERRVRKRGKEKKIREGKWGEGGRREKKRECARAHAHIFKNARIF